MQSTDQKYIRPDERADADVAGDVAAVVDILRRLVRGRTFEPGFDGIDVSIGENEPGVAYCTVTIKGDTTADRDAIKAKFPKSDGWTCKNTGDKTAVCTNP